MAQDNGSPAGLHPRVAKLLLDKLETDNDFRKAFVDSPEQALRSIGHTEGTECLALKPGATLASPEQIKASRDKLEQSLVGIQSATCPLDAQEAM
ncbi:MAG TPA: NHLP-related RiPP peptide [Thermomonas sp.]|jgi:putative modified peptide|nr:NHLP-related RiPP peptide [Thermomonas sp.]HPM57929.1 NHLP-related RiPP peptide [Thermomonas sp.]